MAKILTSDFVCFLVESSFPSFSLLIFTFGSTNFYVTGIKHWSHCLDRNCQSCKFNTLKSTGIQTRVASFECDCITTWQKFRQSPSSSSPFWIFFCSIRITLKVFIFDRRHLMPQMPNYYSCSQKLSAQNIFWICLPVWCHLLWPDDIFLSTMLSLSIYQDRMFTKIQQFIHWTIIF